MLVTLLAFIQFHFHIAVQL